jgi:hypothetical protein
MELAVDVNDGDADGDDLDTLGEELVLARLELEGDFVTNQKVIFFITDVFAPSKWRIRVHPLN